MSLEHLPVLKVLESAPVASACLERDQGQPKVVWSNAAWDALPSEILQSVFLESDEILATTLPRTFSISRPSRPFEIAVQPLSGSIGLLVTLLASEAKLKSSLGTPQPLREGALALPVFTERLKGYGEYGKRTLEYDWASTPIGPIEYWSDTLKTAVAAILASNLSTALWVGDGPVPMMIYNQAYANMVPSIDSFGTRGEIGYGRNWAALLEIRRQTLESRNGMSAKDSMWEIANSQNVLEERFFDYEYIPLYSPDGEIVTCVNRAFETTDKVLARRRLTVTQRVGDLTSTPGNTQAFCTAFLEVLAADTVDLPFALLYTSTQIEDVIEFSLRGAKGLSEQHPWAPSSLHVPSRTSASPWRIDEVLRTGHVVVVDDLESDLANKAVSMPMFGENGIIQGILILGLNPKRPLDSDYAQWTASLAQAASTGLSQTLQSSRIYELERLQTQLADQSDEMTAMTDASTTGVFNLDENGKVLYLNKRWYEIVGAPLEMPGDEWPSHVRPDNLADTYRIFAEAIEQTAPCDLNVVWNSGAVTLVTMRPWKLRNGTQRFTGCVVDVTELRRLERLSIEAAQERAAEAEEQKRLQEISVDVSSHELRNPLSAVTQAAEILDGGLDRIASAADKYYEGGEISEAVYDTLIDELVLCDEVLTAIKLSSQHQRRVADDILNFSKLNMSLITLNRQPMDVVELAEVTSRMLQPELQRQKMRIVIAEEPSLAAANGRYILADAHRLGQVLVNFLTNAMRYANESPKREIDVCISASLTAPEKPPEVMRVLPSDAALPSDDSSLVWTTVSVRDYGRGLSSDECQQLFQRFHQARPGTDSLSGFGLGLFIARSIVHLHSGFIELRSVARGQGTTFSFCIPAERASAEQAVPIVPQQHSMRTSELSKRRSEASTNPANLTRPRRKRHGSSFVSVTSSAPSPSPRQVLICDDSSINLRLLQMQLERRGYSVLTASNGQEALDQIRSRRSAIMACCLDVEMPVKSGPAAVRELRQEEAAQDVDHLYCIACTGNAREAQKAACIEAGYDRVICKPYDIEELCRMIEEGAQSAGAAKANRA